MFKTGDKFIIEIERKDSAFGNGAVYLVKGIENLYMRDDFLSQLERYIEPKKTDTECDIKIGDEVITENGETFVVTYIGRHRGIPDEVFGIDCYGKPNDYCIDGVTKTGRRVDGLAAFIKTMSRMNNFWNEK